MIHFTPGPTQLSSKTHELLTSALQNDIPSLSHRSKEFQHIYERCDTAIRELFSLSKSFNVFFLGSATEAMERIIQNCVLNHSHHLVNGAFSERFYEIANELKKKPSLTRVAAGQGFESEKLQISSDTELIAITHNETSTGVSIPTDEITKIRNKVPNAILAVDIVSSAPIPKLDWQSIDCAFFSVQKCFGLPAGLGVLLVNDRAIARAAVIQNSGQSIGSYHSFLSLLSFAKKYQTPETPNVLSIYLLAGVAEHLSEYGIDKIRAESHEKAQLIYNFLDENSKITAFVKETCFRSETVITASIKGELNKLTNHLKQSGFQVGSGYGEYKDSQIRIANFPTHTKDQIESLINILTKY